MVCLHEASLGRGNRWVVRGVFFAGLWAYVWGFIRPGLIFDAFGIYLPYPEFWLDRASLREAWSRPGGLLEYVSAFLSQWFSVPSLGALVVAATAGLICLGIERVIREPGETRWWFPSLLPGLAVVVLYQTYHDPLTALLALAVCLWLTAAYQAVASPRDAGTPEHAVVWRTPAACRLVVFLAICLGLYWLAGAVCVLFGMLVGIWHACVNRRVTAGAAAVAACAVVPWGIHTQLCSLSLVEAYSIAWPFGLGTASDMEAWPLNILRGLFLFPVAMLPVAALVRRLATRSRGTALPASNEEPGSPSCAIPRRRGRALRVLAGLLVPAVGFAAVRPFLRAPHRESRFEMVHFAIQRQWDELLRVARRVPPSGTDCFYRHLVNRALYHTGRLADEQFSFPQDRAGLLLLSGDACHGAPKYWMLSEIAWELGDVNFAEQRAFERIEGVGQCPSSLELLAMASLVKDRTQERPTPAKTAVRPSGTGLAAPEGQPPDIFSPSSREAARVLLNRMAENPIHARRAGMLIEMLDGTRPPDGDLLGEIARVRALQCVDDRVFQDYSDELMLESLLHANPHNKMAFEYLMAFYLLTRRTDRVVQNLSRLDDLDYREIPRHYEEAILIHANATSQEIPLHGRKIRPETIERLRRFAERFRPLREQPQAAANALADEFGDSYFYYYAFGVSGTGGPR